MWSMAGGARGAAMVALLAVAGMIVPMKFGPLFLDPAILLAYNGVAFLFAADFAVRGAVGCGDALRARRIVLLGSAYGWICWALVLGAALGALAVWRGRLAVPPAGMLLLFAAAAGAVAWLSASLACVAALNVQTVKAARDLMRLGFFFVLLIGVVGPRFLPAAWQEKLRRFVEGEGLAAGLLIAIPLMVLMSWGMMRHARTLIEERNTPLHITGE